MNAKRRVLLTLLATLTCTPFLAPKLGAVAAGFRRGEHSTTIDAFGDLFSNRQAARAVGLRYLASYPQEADAAGLRAHLFGESTEVDGARLRAHLAKLRRDDFAYGNTVILDGWLLARSELRACALLAMTG